MTRKMISVACALALLIVGVATAQGGHSILLGKAIMAGGHQLKSGEYGVKVKGSEVVITSQTDGKSVTVPITIEQNATKNRGDSFDVTNVGGKETLTTIYLGGSTTKLVLTQ